MESMLKHQNCLHVGKSIGNTNCKAGYFENKYIVIIKWGEIKDGF